MRSSAVPSRTTLEHAWFAAARLIIAAGFANRLGGSASVTPGNFLGLNLLLDLTSWSHCSPCVEVGSKLSSTILRTPFNGFPEDCENELSERDNFRIGV